MIWNFTDVEKPTPKAGGVLIKVHATSVNDWDWRLMRGSPFYIRLLCGLLKPNIQIPGAEVAGRVEAIGQNVTKFRPGDAVYGDISKCGFGGFAETNRSIFNYLRALNPGGTYVTVGGLTPRLLQALLLGPIIRLLTGKDVRLVGLKPNKDLAYVNQLFEASKIKPVLDGFHKLSEVPRLIQYFGEGKHKGKIVIDLE